MQYVKVENGVITEGPKDLSSSSFDSPNVHWSASQMKDSGYIIVDLTYNDMVEIIDYANPVISDNSVTYPRIPLTTQQQIDVYNAKAISNRRAEYPPTEDILVALWELVVESRPATSTNLQQIRLAVKQRYPKK